MQSRTRLVIVGALAALAITPLSTVSAQHLADPAAAKLADSCQKAILKAGSAFAAKKLSRLDKCVDGILVCVQTKAPDDACRTKTAASCSKALASIADDEATLVSAVQGKCDPLTPADLFDPAGV